MENPFRPSQPRRPSPARPQPLTDGPRLSARARAHVLFLPPSLSRSLPVGPIYRRRSPRARARPLSLARGPHPSGPVPNLPPAHSRRGRANARAFSDHLRTPSPPLEPAPPAHLRPQSSTLSLRAYPGSSVVAHQNLPPFYDHR
jgi:hypothetical protein